MSADPKSPRTTGPHAVVPAEPSAARSQSRRRVSQGDTTRASGRRTGPVAAVPPPRPPARRGSDKAPTLFLMLGVPLVATAGVVGLAAAHTALGSPLGPKWASELWDMVRNTVGMWLFYGPFIGWVQRKNAQAAITDGVAGGAPAGRHSGRELSAGAEEEDDVDGKPGRPRRADRRRT